MQINLKRYRFLLPPRHLSTLFLFFVFSTSVYGHQGGLNGAGCHNDHINGGYHCHDGSGSSGAFSWAGKTVTSNIEPTKEKIAEDDETTQDVESLKTAFPVNRTSSVKLKKVIDGDTIVVTENGKDYKIRLYGIDTPESEQQGGLNASISLFFFLEAKSLKIKIKDYDKYGRVVGMVYADDENANEKMVKDGLARQYKKYCKDELCEKWLQYEGEAKELRKGVWKESSPEAPWEWRKKNK